MKHDIESFSPKSHTPLLSDLSLKKVMKVSPGTCSLMGEEVDLSIIIMFLPLGIEDPFALSDFNPVIFQESRKVETSMTHTKVSSNTLLFTVFPQVISQTGAIYIVFFFKPKSENENLSHIV